MNTFHFSIIKQFKTAETDQEIEYFI